MKTNQTAVQATAKSNILQADPILLSVITKLSECKAAIEAYSKAHAKNGDSFYAEAASDFDECIFGCLSSAGDMIGYQIIAESKKLYSHE